MTEQAIPTPAQIDAMARDLAQLQAFLDEMEDAIKAKKDELLPIITRHGYAPDKTAKSLRLEGIEYDLTATFGQSVSVVKKAVEKFAVQLGEDGDGNLFGNFFLTDADYIPAPERESYIGKLSTKARNLLAKCLRTTQRKPIVKAEARNKHAQKASA